MVGHRMIAPNDLRHFRPLARPRRIVRDRMAMKPDRCRLLARTPTISCAITAASATTTLTVVYAVVPPQAARIRNSTTSRTSRCHAARDTRRGRRGVVISGMKDAGDRPRALCHRDLDRQRHPAGARPEEGGADHLRGALQRARPHAVVRASRPCWAAPRNSIPRSPGATTRATACCCAMRSR